MMLESLMLDVSNKGAEDRTLNLNGEASFDNIQKHQAAAPEKPLISLDGEAISPIVVDTPPRLSSRPTTNKEETQEDLHSAGSPKRVKKKGSNKVKKFLNNIFKGIFEDEE